MPQIAQQSPTTNLRADNSAESPPVEGDLPNHQRPPHSKLTRNYKKLQETTKKLQETTNTIGIDRPPQMRAEQAEEGRRNRRLAVLGIGDRKLVFKDDNSQCRKLRSNRLPQTSVQITLPSRHRLNDSRPEYKKRRTHKSPPGTRDGNRTRTGITAHRILSPACLPIPPPEHCFTSCT